MSPVDPRFMSAFTIVVTFGAVTLAVLGATLIVQGGCRPRPRHLRS